MALGRWLVRIVEAAVITVTIAAVCHELEKPVAEQRWHGRVGFVPYDFRPPTFDKFKGLCRNPDDDRIFTQAVWGIGWAINFYTLFERMRVIGEYYVTEDDFLMPTPTLRRILENRPSVA